MSPSAGVERLSRVALMISKACSKTIGDFLTAAFFAAFSLFFDCATSRFRRKELD